jgi:hypothetical protein
MLLLASRFTTGSESALPQAWHARTRYSLACAVTITVNKDAASRQLAYRWGRFISDVWRRGCPDESRPKVIVGLGEHVLPEPTCTGRPAGLFGDEGYPLAHPGVFDELARLPLQRGQYGVDRRPKPGMTAATCVFTNCVS